MSTQNHQTIHMNDSPQDEPETFERPPAKHLKINQDANDARLGATDTEYANLRVDSKEQFKECKMANNARQVYCNPMNMLSFGFYGAVAGGLSGGLTAALMETDSHGAAIGNGAALAAMLAAVKPINDCVTYKNAAQVTCAHLDLTLKEMNEEKFAQQKHDRTEDEKVQDMNARNYRKLDSHWLTQWRNK